MLGRRRTLGNAAVTALVAVASAAFGVVGVAATPTPAGALPTFSLSRLAGADRYATAAAVARDTFDSATTAIIASGENFPDALAGNYLAGRIGAPVLLTGRTSLPNATRQALDALGVERVRLLGGTGAISGAVAAALAGAGYTVERVAGSDRFDTAAAIARAGGAPPSHAALLASGRSFPDALAAGPLAYGSALPQLLTEGHELPASTTEAITALGINQVIVLGGGGVVSPAVEDELRSLGVRVSRIAGSDRYSTSVAIADWAVGALGHQRAHVDVATGGNFPDALAGGAHAGRARATVLLVEPAAAGGAAARSLAANTASVASGHAFGGPSAISDASIAALEAAGRGAPSTPAAPPPPTGEAACESALLGLVNGERAARSLAPYTPSTAAGPIARSWSEHMRANGGLSHNTNLSRQLQNAGIAWTMWAENVSYGPSPTRVHELLMSSAVHRGNILSTELTHIAVGCAIDGSGTHWVTEIFYRL